MTNYNLEITLHGIKKGIAFYDTPAIEKIDTFFSFSKELQTSLYSQNTKTFIIVEQYEICDMQPSKKLPFYFIACLINDSYHTSQYQTLYKNMYIEIKYGVY